MQKEAEIGLKDGLKASYLSSGLTDEEIQRIVEIARDVSYGDGEVIVRQFDLDSDLFVVVEGKVVINASNNDLVARIKPGGVFGEIAMLDERPRSATVHAETPTRLAHIPANELRALMDAYPDMAVKLLRNLGRTLCGRLRSANLQIEALLLGL